MRISRRRLVSLLLAATAATGALYTASWSADWQSADGSVPLRVFPLDVDRFGLAPAVYWLPAPDRLLLVPASLAPLGQDAAPDGDVLVVDLDAGNGSHGGNSAWRRISGREAGAARHVFWDLPQEWSAHHDEEILSSDAGGRGPIADLAFHGFSLPVPAYDANLPPFGEAGWHLQRRRFGRWRLTAGDLGTQRSGASPGIRLTRWVLNSAQNSELSSMAAWLPGGRYLVLVPKTGSPRLLLAGPFPAAPSSES
jgi:hypothetical protein